MISHKIKDKPMLLTSHRLQMNRIAKKIEAIPVAELSPDQKRFLANHAQDEKGIITARDVQEFKQASVSAPLPIPKEFVKAPANKPEQKKKVEIGKSKAKKNK